MLTAKVAPERLVFVDENAGLTLRWRRSTDTRPKASDCAFGCPEKEGQEYHAALEHAPLSGMGPSLAVEGATTARVFEAYVKKVLAPSLQEAGRVVIMDNLEAPTGPQAREGARRAEGL